MINSRTMRILRALLTIFAVVCVFSVVYHMGNQKYKTETAIFSTASESAAFRGVYVRNEQVTTYNGNGAVGYEVSDGGKLGIGSVIAHVYSDETQIDIVQQIAALQDELELLKKIQNPGTSESAQPANLSSLIEERYRSLIFQRERAHFPEVDEEKDELLVLLSTYQKITNDTIDFNARIASLNAQIASLQSRQTQPLDTILADRCAYFVSYADGYESTLTKEKLSTITPEEIEAVSDDGTAQDARVIGKLIDGYEWYITGVIDNTKSMFAPDTQVTLKFESTSAEVTGTISELRTTEDPRKSVVVVRCDTMTHDLVQHRAERVEMIKGYYEGIKVSRAAIRFKEVEETHTDPESGEETTETVNAKGVYVLMGEQLSFRRLDVIYEGSDYVLTSLGAGSDYVTLYDDIVVDGVSADGT